ncbi:MAG: helix-turn-helix domain-containing protein [Megamonas funiformis]|uniref:helix-turn-helix domain-containing protein n=1 Tax=Megamonas funiformis TaxID=437897 RepID=UPI0039918F3C
MIGDIIRQLRDKHDIKQQDFAKFLNIGKSTLSQYENGNRVPNDEIKKKISDFFNVSIDYLLEMTSIPDKIDDYIKKDVTERVIQQPKLNLSSNEQSLIMKFRKLPTRIQDKIEARIEAEYDIVMENKQESRQNA